MQFIVTYCGNATVDGADDPIEALADHLDEVMTHLHVAEDGDSAISDADLSATLATGDVEFTVIVAADTPDTAAHLGIAAIRSAIHAAHGHTPGWENAHEVAWVMEFTGSTQRPAALAHAGC